MSSFDEVKGKEKVVVEEIEEAGVAGVAEVVVSPSQEAILFTYSKAPPMTATRNGSIFAREFFNILMNFSNMFIN